MNLFTPNSFAQNQVDRLARRDFLGKTSTGLGAAALASLMGGASAQAAPAGLPGLAGLPHFPPKAKRVVYLWQGGGSHPCGSF